MKKSIKRIIIFCALCTIFISICFYRGYKIPQQDKHKDWPEFPNHTNKELVIKKDGKSISKFTLIPNSDLLLVNYKNPDSAQYTYAIMSRTGNIICDFGYSNNGILMDLIHNRLLVSHIINNDTTTYEAYDAKTFKPMPVKSFKTGIAQSFDDYLMQERGSKKPDYKGGTQKYIEYRSGENEELFKEKYKSKNIKFAKFLNNLTELFRFDENSDGYENASYVKCAKDGSLYKFTYDDRESIEILSKGFFDDKYRKGEKLHYKKEHLSSADSSIIVGNEFNSHFRLDLTGTPTGNNGGSSSDPEFNQININYYQFRLKSMSTIFKVDERKELIFYVGYYEELNNPKNDNDTLTFLSDGNLYLLYKRN